MSGIVFALPLGVIIVVIFIVSLFLHFVPIGLWISARAAGVNVGIFRRDASQTRYSFENRLTFGQGQQGGTGRERQSVGSALPCRR